MRKIKFRAWSAVKKQWMENVLLLGCIDGLPLAYFIEVDPKTNITQDLTFDVSELDLTIQQYTGAKDRNGIEIYEGDIIKWGMSHNQENSFPNLRVIEFYEPQLIYKMVDVGNLPVSVDYLYEAIGSSTRWCEVVGNIFENPELLKL